MPKYLIHYIFNGGGDVEIKAKNKEEAKEAFFQGECDLDNEITWDHEITEVKILPKN
jgi:hypothetical protein